MRRIGQSLVGGAVLVSFLLLLLFLGDWLVSTNRFHPPAWVEMAIVWPLGWPLLLLDRFLPATSSVALLTTWRIIIASAVDVLVYSALIYLFLWWRVKQRRLAQVVQLSAAQQIVGRERRGRVSQLDSSGDG